MQNNDRVYRTIDAGELMQSKVLKRGRSLHQ
jgi:hypothetical protein